MLFKAFSVPQVDDDRVTGFLPSKEPLVRDFHSAWSQMQTMPITVEGACMIGNIGAGVA